MMIGLASDAHGNVFGLQRCLNLLEESAAERLFFLGDALGYFSKPKEVLELLRDKRATCVKGNHEDLIMTGRGLPLEMKRAYNLENTRSVLRERDYAYLASWADCVELIVDSCKVLMVHGSPFDHFEEYIYPDSDLKGFLDLEYDVIFMGHTHVPFARDIGGKTIVNVGSAGFCRNDGRFVTCATFDSQRREVKILRQNFPAEHLDELGPFHTSLREVLKRRPRNRSVSSGC